MVETCSAANCTNRRSKGVKMKFHRIPKNPELRKLWLHSIRRINFHPSERSVICEKHFSSEDYEMNVHGNRVLKKTAVPSVFDLKKEPKKRRVLKRKYEEISNTVDETLDILCGLTENLKENKQKNKNFFGDCPSNLEDKIMSSDCDLSTEFPDDKECCEAYNVKIENVEIHEQFIDENGIYERIAFNVKTEDSDFSIQPQPIHTDSVIHFEATTMNTTKFPDGRECNMKIENVEIQDQFIDENGILERMAFNVKKEDSDFSIQPQPTHTDSVIHFEATTINNTKFPDGKECNVKIENVEIHEQFIDENCILERMAFKVKKEDSDFSHSVL